MPYVFFGGSGLMSDRGTNQIPMIYTLLVGGEAGGKKYTVLVYGGFGSQEQFVRHLPTSRLIPDRLKARK
jgi:hypothetical protein